MPPQDFWTWNQWDSIMDQRRFVINRAELTTRINVYQATSSRPLWPLMQAGGSGKDLILKKRVAVEKGLYWSKSVNCTDGIHVPMPEGHNYQDWNISHIDIRSGGWVDFINITYKHRTSGETLNQELGNVKGGTVPSTGLPRDLWLNPIVKAVWISEEKQPFSGGVGDLKSIEFTQADRFWIKAGENVPGEEDCNSVGCTSHLPRTAIYQDNFSIWKGGVWLCGMVLHGDSSRVKGIAPHWCYNELYTTTTTTTTDK